MSILRKPSPGRTAMILMLIALLLTLCVAVYLFLARLLRPVHLGGGELTRESLRSRLTILLTVVLASVLLILIFVVGSYLVMQVGRTLKRRSLGGPPTQYEDAWSHYRLSAEEIEAATREDRGDTPPGGGRPEPPPESDPQDPDSKG